jgi:peptidyl-dipeptidase A
VNEGAKEMGFADAGEMWRSGYDMSPAELAAETDRLWDQVKPLYEQLHCYARGNCRCEYGKDKGEVAGGMIARAPHGQPVAAGLGQPLGHGAALPGRRQPGRERRAAERAATRHSSATMARRPQRQRSREAVDRSPACRGARHRQEDDRARAGLLRLAGHAEVAGSYWENSQLIKPRDRDVVCHASAWDMNMAGDVRTKMCIAPTEEELTTIYHELGHIYYDLAYNPQPPLFQSGAHDGFHEAIGDTIVLAMTPAYLQSVGLVGAQQRSKEALINAQMRMALAKVAFLPFGLMIDRWRWGVFDGSIKPDTTTRRGGT